MTGELEQWMLRRVADRLGLAPHEVGTETPLADFGFSSTDAVAFSGDLEKHCGVAVPPTLFWEHPTIAAIARHLAGTSDEDEVRATQDFEPIAVIGVGCRFPGGADSPAGLWRLLVEGRDAVREGPHDRWDVEAFYDPDSGTAGRSTSKWAAYLDDVAGFDAAFFGVPAREAAAMDPQHRLLLEVSWEALEHAGLPPRGLERTRTGVFAGLCYTDYAQRVVGRYSDIDAYVGTGNAHSTAVGRISYLLGLNGPSVAIDTACSSSLVAIHLACQSLRLGESDLAVAGGASLLLRPEGMIIGSRWGMLSATGRCHSFDARADGFVRGEGAGAVVLKRLADAERDGDRVLAVVRGSAVNQDGRSQGLTAPSVSAQRAVLAEAVQLAGVDPGDVELIESHGTGTPLGDPIEFAALADVYGTGTSRCALGAVKSNLGHTEGAAGVAGFIKAVLALHHGVVPPNLHFESWNPEIPASASRFFVPTDQVPLTRGLAAVSSFGMSGTNAHAVLACHEGSFPSADRHESSLHSTVEVFPVSAGSEAVLVEAAGRLADWVRTEGAEVPLRDIAATLACRRSHTPARTAVVARTRDELLAGLAQPVTGTVVAGAARGPVWVFSGQGSQWARMGAGLLADPAFRAALDEVEPLVERESGFSVRETLAHPDVVTGIDHVQPTLFAMQVALAAAWRARGVEPAAVIGHSMGEIAAAVVAGALSIEDGVRVVCRRSRLMDRLSGAGAMASVDLSRADVERELTPGVTVAVVASPRSTVVAGATDEVERLVAAWEERGLVARLVAVDVASHSPQVDPIVAELASLLTDLTPQEAETRWYSTVRDDADCDAAYWVDNLRRPVRLADAVTAARDDGHSVFVEVSPHPVLAHALTETLGDDAVVLHTLKRDQDEEVTIAGQLAALYRAGCPVRWTTRGRLADVPTTTWDRKRHWIELPLPHPDQEFAAGGTAHPLLGEHVEVPGGEHVWRADLGTKRLPWLADHQVDGLTVLPGAGFCEIAVAAAAELFGAEPHEVEVTDVTLDRFLAVGERGEVSTVVRAVDRDRARCEVLSRSGDEWVRHATAQLRRTQEAKRPPALDTVELSERIDPEEFYGALRAAGYFHGPAFAGIEELSRAGDTVFAKVRAPRSWPRRLHLHPALLDSCLQALAAAPLADTGDEARLTPSGFGGVRIFGDPRRTAFCRAQLEADGDEVTGQVALLDADGAVLACVDDVRLLRFEPPVDIAPLLHEISWEPVPLGDARPGGWRVVGDGELADRVRARIGDEDARQVALIVGDGDGRDEVLRFLDLLRASADRVRVVTRGGLEQAALRGITRVAMFEHAELRPALVELDPALTDPGQLADQLVAELRAGGDEDEVSWRSGERCVARLVPSVLKRPQRTVAFGRDGFGLDITRYGDLDTLGLVVRSRRVPDAGEVEIQVHAAGMNFRDVYIAMGFYPVEGAMLGSDCAGVVSAVGPDVTGLSVGDRVMTLADGAFGSFVTVGADRVVRIPADTSFAEAATMPAAYLTAWHALRDVARLAPGERVLIHSASGGVGLAAIAVARACGAEILATAGNAHKREYLRGLGIEHVMDSRTLDFVDQTLQATGGEGVDVVLNSLSGPALAAGLDVLAVGGRFVEIGKRDIYADSKLGLLPFRRNISLCSVDLDLVLRTKKALSLRLLGEVATEIHASRLKPLPHQEIALEDAVTAFRTMASAKHIGRIVLAVPQQGETTAVVPAGTVPVVRADGAYIITGGLGGLGTEMARWLTARGAGRVVLNSRTARPSEYPVVVGDIASPGVASELVAAATSGGLPLRGIIHAAGVLGDGLLDGLDAERLAQVWRPKVEGAKQLHSVSAGHDLDWFVLFSSAAALFGNPGQGAYAAANSWLDGFAAWRRELGLPALSVNWGVWAARGMAEVVAGRGFETFSVREGVAALETLLDHEVTRAGVFPFDTEGLLSVLPAAAESSFFAAMPLHRESGPSGTVAASLLTVDPARRAAVMVTHLAERIAAILGTGVIDPDQPLAHLGIDSLTALQLRNRLESDLAISIPATAVWAHPSITALAAYLLDRMDLGEATPSAAPVRSGVVLRYATRERARTRLYCFPYMGGSASAFRSWASECPSTVELCALQPPGRENRAEEPFADDVRALADAFADALLAEADERPFVFFGHSGGAVLAFETARALRRRGERMPLLLGVSSMLAPHDPRWASRVQAALGDASSDAILRMGAVPREVLDDPNLTALVEPVIRADVTLFANYAHKTEQPLDCPIRTFAGEHDPIYAPDELTTWRELTTGEVIPHSYPGGHFYFRDQLAQLISDLCADL